MIWVASALVLVFTLLGFGLFFVQPSDPEMAPKIDRISDAKSTEQSDRFELARQRMVERDLKRRDIDDPQVLDAMGRVERHRFVPPDWIDRAYEDSPLPIGQGQTISQPYIVALMTQLVRPTPECRVLDVGTGSGYQAAVLGELCREVYSIEIVEPLADQARERLKTLGYENITVRCGDGYRGWPEKAPFDLIVVAAAPDHIPKPLVEQLAPGGRLIIPVGQNSQQLILIEKRKDGTLKEHASIPVRFVPMTGEAEDHPISDGLEAK